MTSMPPPVAPAPPKSSSSRATWSLVLSILGIICCQILAPIAWYLGSQELAAIRAGQSPPGGEGLAKAGMIMGIIGTILLAFTLCWVFFFGGLAMLSAMGHR